jgi:hypothetical protein
MITYELVFKPLVLAIVLFITALLFFVWLNKYTKRSPSVLKGKTRASLVGWSLCILGVYSLFISLFFLIAG